MTCISCGEANDGGYEVEDGPGPFCSECWDRLAQYFKADLVATAVSIRGAAERIVMIATKHKSPLSYEERVSAVSAEIRMLLDALQAPAPPSRP